MAASGVLKSLSSMEDKVNTHLANAKIAADDRLALTRSRSTMDHLREHCEGPTPSCSPTPARSGAKVLKAPDDLAALVESRISAPPLCAGPKPTADAGASAHASPEERVKAEVEGARAEQGSDGASLT